MKQLIHAVTIFCAFLAAPVVAQVQPAEPQISASGRGEMRIKPTRAVIIFTVQGRGATAVEAASNNAKLVESTIRSLRSAGLQEEEVTNSGYNVGPEYEYTQTGRKSNGFLATNAIRADVMRTSDVGKIIDAGLAGGATQVGSAQYTSDKMEEARRTALKQAAASARLDAEAMAEAAGGKLGRLLSLMSSSTEQTYRDMAMEGGVAMASGALRSSTAIRLNELNVAATATGRWEYLPRR